MATTDFDRAAAGQQGRWWIGRFGSIYPVIAVFLAISSLTRIVLLLSNVGTVAGVWLKWIPALLVGTIFDLVAVLWLLTPFMVFLLLISDRWLRARVMKWLVGTAFFVLIYGLLYLSVVEWFFFDEFSARFNTVAVDYLIFPHEVFVNLWDTYPVWQALVIVTLVTAALFAYVGGRFVRALSIPTPWRVRTKVVGIYVLTLAVSWFAVSTRLARISDNRVLNEVTLNGLYSFANAAMTNELDYDAYYSQINLKDAVACVRQTLAAEGTAPVVSGDSLSIDHAVTFSSAPRPLNVVLVLEESLGSIFVKSLTPDGPAVTPELERLADSGLLFTHIYATGNRTVRGMEAVLAGFPPIPGQSIVRRPGGQHLFSLPALLKSFDYSTVFLYGGFSYFDNMLDFAKSNAFDRVFDRTDFPKKTFTTIWGVCDEDLFDNALPVLDSLDRIGKPFFSLLLTVSNHSPYRFPGGRLAAEFDKPNRENAVRYADYSLGKFVKDASSHHFFTNTIFVVLGDHGPRVYGSQQIPLQSYRIPVLFYGPGIIPAGVRDSILGSQMDVPSTIMGVLRIPYTSEFFGRDLLSSREEPRAFLSHNRDVALYRDHHLAVLGLGQQQELWQVDSTNESTSRLPLDKDTTVMRDAVAFYQTAYYMYKERKLHPIQQLPIAPTRALAGYTSH